MENESTTNLSSQAIMPEGALDFLKPSPTFITVQAYRASAFDETELGILRDHLDSWRDLLFKHGVIYDGIAANGKSDAYADLLYHAAMAVDTSTYPAALPLVLDALFDLTTELPLADWEVYGMETVVTRLEPDANSKSLIPSNRVFRQHFLGLPSTEEQPGPF